MYKRQGMTSYSESVPRSGLPKAILCKKRRDAPVTGLPWNMGCKNDPMPKALRHRPLEYR